MDWTATGLIELPSVERSGLVWVVLTAGAPLDLDDHLGSLAEELDGWQLGAYEHFTMREFQSEVNWKAALEAFAESYHFPYVHANSLIGQNTIADVAVHQSFGRHHRICFPFPWIRSLDDGEASWDPMDNVAIIYWLFPNLVVAFSTVGVELIHTLLEEAVRSAGSGMSGWQEFLQRQTTSERAMPISLSRYMPPFRRDEDFGMLPQCGDAIRHGQHDHMIIGRNEIGVQHVVRSLARAVGYPLPGS